MRIAILISLAVMTAGDTEERQMLHPEIASEIKSMFYEVSENLRGDTTGSSISTFKWRIVELEREMQGQNNPLVLMEICVRITSEAVKFRHQSRRRLGTSR